MNSANSDLVQLICGLSSAARELNGVPSSHPSSAKILAAIDSLVGSLDLPKVESSENETTNK